MPAPPAGDEPQSRGRAVVPQPQQPGDGPAVARASAPIPRLSGDIPRVGEGPYASGEVPRVSGSVPRISGSVPRVSGSVPRIPEPQQGYAGQYPPPGGQQQDQRPGRDGQAQYGQAPQQQRAYAAAGAPPPAAAKASSAAPGARGTAKVGAFEDTGTFKAISIPDYELHGMTAEDRARRVSTTGQFPQVSVYDYERFSQLTGDIQVAPAGDYKVQYKKLPGRRPIRTALLGLTTLGLEVAFFVWLIVLGAEPRPEEVVSDYLRYAATVLIVTTIVVEAFRLVSTFTLVVATINSRNPIPVWPAPDLRVAFLTTIVPGKEPIEMVEHTLKAATKIRHPGKYDVWLLDEGDDPEVREMCARNGINHFSRKGVGAWNTTAGPHKARTKHGNYNAWIIQHGAEYDVFVSVDPDHAPLPNYCERMLGYFRDPDVAFVVGPQVYGNCDNFVTKASESQQFMFHAIIQRAGNRYGAPMLVGTNNAIRISALMQIQGVQDSITEDFATGMLLHGTRNPDTGRKWKSVYTPDVLAVGEGPSSWSDFFTQQHRWSRGTHELLVQRNFPKLMAHLGPRRIFYYSMLLVYYPTTALMWLVGALNAAMFLAGSVKGVLVPFDLWLMLYVDGFILQTVLYFWNRRHNVSPHEPPGSTGLRGGLISLICGPVYGSSLVGTALRRRTGFVITPKGDAASADRLRTFRKHLQWAVFYLAILGAGIYYEHASSTMWWWGVFRLLLCLAPVVIWMFSRSRRKKPAQIPAPPVRVREMEPAA
ncbi:glycosyltransferase family 2 protein [Cryptosporangium phraense]|nr:cellulose synthase catalytic subunit [Cryptosporangium phraense]